MDDDEILAQLRQDAGYSAGYSPDNNLDDHSSASVSQVEISGNPIASDPVPDVQNGDHQAGFEGGANGEADLASVSEPVVIEDEDQFEGVNMVNLSREPTPLPSEPSPRARVEVVISELPLGRRNEYSTVHSDVVESVVGDTIDRGETRYIVEFTDGRQEMVSPSRLAEYENGEAALYFFRHPRANMESFDLKRKHEEDEWNSDQESVGSDPMDVDDVDDDNDDVRDPPTMARLRRSSARAMRLDRSAAYASHESDEEGDDASFIQPDKPSRNLRARPQRQRTLSGMAFSNGHGSQDQDELAQDPLSDSREEADGDFVTSDVVPAKRKFRKGQRRLQMSRLRGNVRPAARQPSADSDIEFEPTRRSQRTTRNTVDMRDEALMDEDSFYVVDDRSPAVQKAVSVREVFQPLPAESKFASIHMSTCHTCGSSAQRGQLIHCQGCTLSYHKHCLGIRSVREHLATKVGEDSFVLQCRFCIGVYRKKDKNAPRHGMCQECHSDGQACAPFSQKKTSRQEEKLREENGGIDPVTPVSPDLINNPDLPLFRCSRCHRGWHLDHLPPVGNAPVDIDIKSEGLEDYTIDWRCNECSSAKHKIHRIVAWRPMQLSGSEDSYRPQHADFDEDAKEYLVKWETVSYAHCKWMPSAWVFGVAASAMRTSFGKRAVEQDLLKFTKEEAIPDEFLMADIILNVKMKSNHTGGKSRHAEMENISNVSKVFVKFQGLGYDDVVWDSPPSQDAGEIYDAFVEAYGEYIEGKYFRNEAFSKVRDRVKSFKASEFEEVDKQPDALKRGKLMGYQLEGLNWLLKNYHSGRSVVLADEMGLGKTVQVISLVASLVQDKPKCWPFLIVVPNATCPNWRREFKQWTPDLRVVTYHGGRESQELAYKYELFPNGSNEMRAHAVIMSYDSAQDPRTMVLFKSVHWAGLVVDEGQRLKNDENLLYLALRSMRIPFRLLLTGTPLQNNKRELFNLLQFIDESQDAMKLDEEFQVLDKVNLPKLHEKIRPYFLRRTKAGVLKFLPPMAQIILPVTMTVIQEKLSKSIMAKNPQLIQSMFANSKINRKERGSLNNILMQLRKCLCHPFLYSEAIEERHRDPTVMHRNLIEASAKLLLLEVMLPKLKERGHRVLIFSQFLGQLDIIEDFLNGMGFGFRRLDGQISSLEKQRRIDAFNAPDSPLFAFLLSTRAGGVGINLATADTVIIMDPDFNPHQDMQALSRAHRIGQKNKVLCFQLMTKDSIEERIMQVGRKKMALDHALIESMDDDDLAGDDLESILKHGAQALFDEGYQKTAIHYDSASVDNLLERSEVEKTKTDEESSAETQFSYARVWANEKSGFDDGLGIEEDQAPEPITSGVWDKILAQREEEAKREEEATREVLGRGNRRRTAINYKTNTLDNTPLPEGVGQESSDSSDDFAGADTADDDTDEEMKETAKGKRRKTSPIQTQTPIKTPTKKSPKSKPVDKHSQQKSAKTKPRSQTATPRTPVGKQPKASPKTHKLEQRSKGPAAGRGQLPSPIKSGKKVKSNDGQAGQSSPTRGKGTKPISKSKPKGQKQGTPGSQQSPSSAPTARDPTPASPFPPLDHNPKTSPSKGHLT